MYNQQKQNDDKMDRYRSMIEDFNDENGIQNEFVTLSESQRKALNIFKEGKNALILGAAGSGKSKLIQEMKYITNKYTNKKIVVTATTGIASYNVNGLTINSFLGIGTGEQEISILIKRVSKKACIRQRLRSTDILVIDEISMMSAELFEKIDLLCQAILKKQLPFGGIQVVMTGDFHQLLPCFNKNENLFANQDKRLIFESDTFNMYFKSFNTVTLTSNFRQNDPLLLEILTRIRTGDHTENDMTVLQSRLNVDSNVQATVHLVSSNKQAQIINLTNLNNLKTDGIRFEAKFSQEGKSDIAKELTNELESQFRQKGIIETVLKQDARVMLIKNLCIEDGLVNGSVGTVTSFQTSVDNVLFPVVRFDNGITRTISPVDWELEIEGARATAVQLPLMLCWAITIHKCQSITLDKAVMDLASCFTDAMVYVALSRVRTLDGIFLNSFDKRKIKANEKVKEYLSNIN